MVSLPVIVFVPGAWHTPAGFRKVMDLLQASGFRCEGLSLPTVGSVHPVASMDQDVALIRDTVTRLSDGGSEVVIVMHSYGGAPTGNALEGLSRVRRLANGQTGGVIKLAMIASFLLPEGGSVAGGRPMSSWCLLDGDLVYALDPEVHFYSDLETEEAARWSSELQPMSCTALRAETIYAAWREIPVNYLLCEKDQALPPSFQEQMVAAARASGACIEVERISAAHSPFLSHPEAVAEWIRKAAVGKQIVSNSLA